MRSARPVDRVRIGFVGIGSIATQHIRNLLSDPLAEVVALCDVDEGIADRARGNVLASPGDDADPAALDGLSRASLHSDPRAMLEEARPDAVFVCVPPFAHGPAELAAAEARVAMLVEKPVALDFALAVRVRDAIAASGVVNAAGYQGRYGALVPFVRGALDGRRVGMAAAFWFCPFPGHKTWYRGVGMAGGQVVEMATHQIDFLRCLVGEICAFSSVSGRTVVTSAPPEVADAECAAIEFESGAVGCLATNFLSPDHVTPPQARGIHLFAEGATVSMVGHVYESCTVQVFTERGMMVERVFPAPMRLQDRTFVRAVHEGRQELILSSYAEAVRNLAASLAHMTSVERGRRVTVAEVLDAVGATC